jgi:DNA-directed RNA polymerase
LGDFFSQTHLVPKVMRSIGSRSLLVFAKGKPLGPSGLDWLKIHCVNLTGKKKKETIQARSEADSIFQLCRF